MAGGQSRTPCLPACVHVVDDDTQVRTALARLLAAHGYEVQPHATAADFLAAHDARQPGCILLDLALPDLDGLALQERLAAQGSALPIVFLTGQADVQACANAFRSGAVDFLTKPVDEDSLVAAIDKALAREAALRVRHEDQERMRVQLASLTPRERQVLAFVARGKLNKQIAGELGTTEKTVKVHRARGLQKMGVRAVAHLVRNLERSGLGHALAAAGDP
ncbi:response regulator transcription factor [Ramlibacter sp. G-1-2-2]|uniref:Response regulator transcription factor n=2 Tax=Ramlibacter agri TaxID=2728837 RepID=A0A848H4W5_9BURK|nr:response regulator transcription factor [Ramlibacter agri]